MGLRKQTENPLISLISPKWLQRPIKMAALIGCVESITAKSPDTLPEGEGERQRWIRIRCA